MQIQVTLSEERKLEIDVDPEEWREALDEARQTGQMIEIRNSAGRVLAINPQQILYWVEVAESDSQHEVDKSVSA